MPNNSLQKQEKFCQVYIETGNATQAYRQAYPTSQGWKEASVHVQAQKSLDNPKVADHIQELRERQAARHDIKADRLTKEYARIALADPRRLLPDPTF